MKTITPDYRPRKALDDTFVFGKTLSDVKSGVVSYLYGYPGSALQLKYRPSGPQTYIPVYSEWFHLGDSVPRVFQHSHIVRTRKSTGATDTIDREYPILRTAYAGQTSINRAQGKWETITFPSSSKLDPIRWRHSTPYMRSEAVAVLHASQGTFVAESSVFNTVETVTGVSAYSGCFIHPITRPYFNGPSTTIPHAMQMLARSRAIQKVRDSDFQLSVALAESKKTFDHLAASAVTLFKAYRAVKRGDLKGFLQQVMTPQSNFTERGVRKSFYSSRDAAQRWLEVQYAWTPLLKDVNGALELLSKPSVEPLLFKVTGSVAETFNVVDDSKWQNRNQEMHITDGVRVAKAIYYYAVTDPAAVLAQQIGLNPAAAIWETIPWSFVIDWFLTIGTAIEAIDAWVGKQFVGGSHIEFVRGYQHSFLPLLAKQSAYGWQRVGNAYSKQQMKILFYRRTPVYRAPTVIPWIKNPLSTTHVVNAIALTRSLHKR